jgi:hypothetical protein
MSDCKVFRREIEEAADGRPASAAARAHLALCRACGEELRERERLRALVGGLGRVEAPADFEFRLRARMAASRAEGGRNGFNGRWLYGFAPVAVAACFLIVSATLYFRQAARPRTEDMPVAAASPAQTPAINKTEVAPVESAKAGGQTVPSNPVEVASSRVHKVARRSNARAAQAREVALRNERRTDVAQQNTANFTVTGAPVIHLPVQSSAEPLRLILRDESGAERVVPMRSVSFGSQDLLSRGAATRPPVATEVGGVW